MATSQHDHHNKHIPFTQSVKPAGVSSSRFRPPRGVLIGWWRDAAEPSYGIPSGIFFPSGGVSKECVGSVRPAASHSPVPQDHPVPRGVILTPLGTGRQSEAPWTKRNARPPPDPQHAVLHHVDLCLGPTTGQLLSYQTLDPLLFRIPRMPPSAVVGASIYIAIIRRHLRAPKAGSRGTNARTSNYQGTPKPEDTGVL
jgi:hypothetical protein